MHPESGPCPVCSKPVPADAGEAAGGGSIGHAECPHCGAALMRVAAEDDVQWREVKGGS